jgi:AraC-like DNA-binding protein
MQDSIHLKYLIVNENDALWGITINTVGYQHIAPNAPYPPNNHPTRYLFSTDKGRILEEYQLLYISKGKGTLITDNNRKEQVRQGNMFLLFPNEWHNYMPDNETGWDEYWIGFKGINIDQRVQNGFFNKQKSVFNVGINDEIVQLYKQAIQIAKEQKTGYQQILAGIVNHLLGLAYYLDKNNLFEDSKSAIVNKAKILMLENIYTNTSTECISEKLNVSYSLFRKLFKEYTGLAPLQYIQQIKLQKSKELLTHSDDPIKEIAYKMGFDNPEYFFTLFKKKTGMTPIKYREFTQGKGIL